MQVTIKLIDALATSAGKKQIAVEIDQPITINKLYELAGEQEGKPALYRELAGHTITYNGKLLEHQEALNREIAPGEELLLLPVMDGG